MKWFVYYINLLLLGLSKLFISQRVMDVLSDMAVVLHLLENKQVKKQTKHGEERAFFMANKLTCEFITLNLGSNSFES